MTAAWSMGFGLGSLEREVTNFALTYRFGVVFALLLDDSRWDAHGFPMTCSRINYVSIFVVCHSLVALLARLRSSETNRRTGEDTIRSPVFRTSIFDCQ